MSFFVGNPHRNAEQEDFVTLCKEERGMIVSSTPNLLAKKGGPERIEVSVPPAVLSLKSDEHVHRAASCMLGYLQDAGVMPGDEIVRFDPESSEHVHYVPLLYLPAVKLAGSEVSPAAVGLKQGVLIKIPGCGPTHHRSVREGAEDLIPYFPVPGSECIELGPGIKAISITHDRRYALTPDSVITLGLMSEERIKAKEQQYLRGGLSTREFLKEARTYDLESGVLVGAGYLNVLEKTLEDFYDRVASAMQNKTEQDDEYQCDVDITEVGVGRDLYDDYPVEAEEYLLSVCGERTNRSATATWVEPEWTEKVPSATRHTVFDRYDLDSYDSFMTVAPNPYYSGRPIGMVRGCLEPEGEKLPQSTPCYRVPQDFHAGEHVPLKNANERLKKGIEEDGKVVFDLDPPSKCQYPNYFTKAKPYDEWARNPDGTCSAYVINLNRVVGTADLISPSAAQTAMDSVRESLSLNSMFMESWAVDILHEGDRLRTGNYRPVHIHFKTPPMAGGGEFCAIDRRFSVTVKEGVVVLDQLARYVDRDESNLRAMRGFYASVASPVVFYVANNQYLGVDVSPAFRTRGGGANGAMFPMLEIGLGIDEEAWANLFTA